jgi:uncharacterized cofD-like protein
MKTKTNEYRLVVLGGGGGVSQIILGARRYFAHCTAVVAVTDTGRSTGIARALAGIPAPGDLRNTLARLAADPNALFPTLLQHRFHSHDVPALEGMAFGNLLLAALAEVTGDFGLAVDTVATLVNSTAQVLPVSLVNTNLCAELENGSIMEHELAVRGLDKPAIRRVFLAEPAAPANPQVLHAIGNADIVALGPGSFFTSVLATLLFAGIVHALQQTSAKVVFLCNTTTQPGQTDGFSALNHIQHLVQVLGMGILDVALINRSAHIAPAVLAQYAADGLHLLQPNDHEIANIAAMGIEPLVGDYTEQPTPGRTLWNKLDTIRHDPDVVGETLWKVVQTYA